MKQHMPALLSCVVALFSANLMVCAQEVTSKKDFDAIINSDQAVIVKFYAPWCGPCQQMGPIFKKVAEKYKDKITFVSVNMEEVGKEIAKAYQYKIEAYPTIGTRSAGQKDLDLKPGFRDEQQLDAVVQSLKSAATEPAMKAMKSSSMDRIKMIENIEEFDKKLASGKPLIIKFSTEWCTFCKQMAPDYEKVAAAYPDILFLEIDGDSEHGKVLMKRYEVRGFPTLFSKAVGESALQRSLARNADDLRTLADSLKRPRQMTVKTTFTEPEKQPVMQPEPEKPVMRGKTVQYVQEPKKYYKREKRGRGRRKNCD